MPVDWFGSESRAPRWLRKLCENLRLPFDCLLAVLPWSFVVGAPFWYGVATAVVLVLGYNFGWWYGLGFAVVAYTPISVVVYRRIQHEAKVQFSMFDDRWEGSEDAQEEALKFLIESSRKRKR